MTNTDWEVIKDFYQREFGIDGWLVEMYANLDILSLCVSGASDDSIVTFLELPASDVVKVLNDTFEFDGWRRDLPLNPYKVFIHFDGIRGSIEHFKSFVTEVSTELIKYPDLEDAVRAERLFYMCEIYRDIEERIQNEWV